MSINPSPSMRTHYFLICLSQPLQDVYQFISTYFLLFIQINKINTLIMHLYVTFKVNKPLTLLSSAGIPYGTNLGHFCSSLSRIVQSNIRENSDSIITRPLNYSKLTVAFDGIYRIFRFIPLILCLLVF